MTRNGYDAALADIATEVAAARERIAAIDDEVAVLQDERHRLVEALGAAPAKRSSRRPGAAKQPRNLRFPYGWLQENIIHVIEATPAGQSFTAKDIRKRIPKHGNRKPTMHQILGALPKIAARTGLIEGTSPPKPGTITRWKRVVR